MGTGISWIGIDSNLRTLKGFAGRREARKTRRERVTSRDALYTFRAAANLAAEDFVRQHTICVYPRARQGYGGAMSRATVTATAAEAPFRLDSVVPTSNPEGVEGTWYRYVISQGTNQIAGVRSGGQAEVTLIVEEMVDRLNERRAGKNGKARAKTA